MTVIYAKALPEHVNARARTTEAKARSAAAAARRTEVPNKSFQTMTPAEKDKLLHVLALQAGLINT